MAADFKGELLALLQEETKGLWKGGEDTAFLESLAADMAVQEAKLRTAKSAAKKKEYKENLAHLHVQWRGRVVQKQNAMKESGVRVLLAVVNTAARVGLTALL